MNENYTFDNKIVVSSDLVWPFRQTSVAVSAGETIVVWPFRQTSVAVSAGEPIGVWPFRQTTHLVCGRFGLERQSSVWPFRNVAVLTSSLFILLYFLH